MTQAVARPSACRALVAPVATTSGAESVNGLMAGMFTALGNRLSRGGQAQTPDGQCEWVQSTRWRFTRIWIAVVSAPVFGWTLYQFIAGQSPSVLGVLLGTLAMGGLFFGLQGKRQVTIVDAEGISRFGDEYWRLGWAQIAQAKAIEGVIMVNPTDDVAAQLPAGDRLFAPIARRDEAELQRLIDHYCSQHTGNATKDHS